MLKETFKEQSVRIKEYDFFKGTTWYDANMIPIVPFDVDFAIECPTEYFNTFEKNDNTNKSWDRLYITDEAFDYIEGKYPYSGLTNIAENISNLPRRWDEYENKAFQVISYLNMYTKNPCIELLAKAGFGEQIARSLINDINPMKMTIINRTCNGTKKLLRQLNKKGTTLVEVMGLPKYIIADVKKENLDTWEQIRLLYKNHKLTKEEWQSVYRIANYNKLKWLISRYDAVKNLCDYLESCEYEQAIDILTSINLLTDYIKACESLGIKPDLKTKNLKRDHDVLVRRLREEKDHQYEEAMELAAKELQKFEYEANGFKVIAPKTAADLYKEANEMRNSLGCYVKNIAEGSILLFLRKSYDEGKSYAALEIDANTGEIIQALKKFNQEITEIPTLAFLEKYEAYIKELLRKGE